MYKLNIKHKINKYLNSKYANLALALIAFLEAFFLIIPVEVFLLPLAIKNKNKIQLYSFITAISSTLGAVIGYLIGFLLFTTIGIKIIEAFHYQEYFTLLKQQFYKYGVWFIVLGAVSPIPFKAITILCGVLHINFLQFILFAGVSRYIRYLFTIYTTVYSTNLFTTITRRNKFILLYSISAIMIVLCIIYIYHAFKK